MKLKEKWSEFNLFERMAALVQDFDLWSATDAAHMDKLYIKNISGNKPCAPLVEDWEGNIDQIALMLYAKYHRNWEQAAKYLVSDYDLYEDVEHEERSFTDTTTQTPDDWVVTSEAKAIDNYSDVSTSTYGFNSTEPVPESTSNSATNSKTTSEQSGTFETEKVYSEEVDRRGSSKLRTGAEMLELDNRFWSNWNYFNLIFRDVDMDLTCPYYE